MLEEKERWLRVGRKERKALVPSCLLRISIVLLFIRLQYLQILEVTEEPKRLHCNLMALTLIGCWQE